MVNANNQNETIWRMAAENICRLIIQKNGTLDASSMVSILETIGDSYMLDLSHSNTTAELKNKISLETKRLLKYRSDIIKLYEAQKIYSINEILQELKQIKECALKIDSIGPQVADKITFFIERIQILNNLK